MAENGRLPESSLRPVAGGGLLEPRAAAAWNAIAAKIYRETGVKIASNGPDSTYRNFERQVYWRNYWCSRGLCGNAAVPGTSNHGLGLAVDTDDHELVNRYGAPFGWQKVWSDAAHEPWHFRFRAGIYDGDDPGPDYSSKPPKPSWWKKVANNIAAARRRRESKRTRRLKLGEQIERIGRAIGRWVKRRKDWLRKHR